MSPVGLVILIYTLLENSRSQDPALRPALVVSNSSGAIRTEQVFFGFVGCENSQNDFKEIINKQNASIKELNEKFDHLNKVVLDLSNRTGFQFKQYEQVTSKPMDCGVSIPPTENGPFIQRFLDSFDTLFIDF